MSPTPFSLAAYTYLSQLPVVGSPAETITVRREFLPEGQTFPCLLFSSSDDEEIVHDGESGRVLVELRLTVFGYDPDQLDEIVRSLSAGLAGKAAWSGLLVQCHRVTKAPALIPPEPATGARRLIQRPILAEMWVSRNEL
jgi:hypothetical protein